MATAHLLSDEQQSITVEQYLKTSFEPDCDYVDGQIEERNLGELEHSRIQKWLIVFFASREKEWGIEAFQEARLQTGEHRFRVPDIMVLPAGRYSGIVRSAPLVCIEVLSPEDRLSRMRERARDYRQMGVQAVWLFDPYDRVAYRAEEDGFLKVKETILTLPGTSIAIPLAEAFSCLD